MPQSSNKLVRYKYECNGTNDMTEPGSLRTLQAVTQLSITFEHTSTQTTKTERILFRSIRFVYGLPRLSLSSTMFRFGHLIAYHASDVVDGIEMAAEYSLPVDILFPFILLDQMGALVCPITRVLLLVVISSAGISAGRRLTDLPTVTTRSIVAR